MMRKFFPGLTNEHRGCEEGGLLCHPYFCLCTKSESLVCFIKEILLMGLLLQKVVISYTKSRRGKKC